MRSELSTTLSPASFLIYKSMTLCLMNWSDSSLISDLTFVLTLFNLLCTSLAMNCFSSTMIPSVSNTVTCFVPVFTSHVMISAILVESILVSACLLYLCRWLFTISATWLARLVTLSLIQVKIPSSDMPCITHRV